MIIKKCKICNKEFITYPCRDRKFCSVKCYLIYSSIIKTGKKRPKEVCLNISKGLKGKYINEKHPQWVGDKVGKIGIHQWLYKNYGKANHCENKNCSGKCKIYHWANLNNHIYRRRRKDFKMLCQSCHYTMDYINGNNRGMFGRKFNKIEKVKRNIGMKEQIKEGK